MISPRMARKFVIPAVAEEAAYLDHCVYHYDGKEALGHLDDILAIDDIDVIQWVPGDGNPRSVEWMDLLKKIQASGKGLWIYDWTIDEIKQFYKELRPEGLLFQVGARTRAEADDLVEWLRKNT
jgi:5-methyltetrahydrofolate--homocysteine methyltransferase